MEPMGSMGPVDLGAAPDMGMGVGMGMGAGGEMGMAGMMPPGMSPGMPPGMPEAPMPEAPMSEVPEAPVHPVIAAAMEIIRMPGPDAVRLVYQLATSAARAKARIKALGDQLDARGYHDALSANPEARYARELIAARRELDVLAAERRRLNLEAVKAREAGRPASIYEMQSVAATSAMEASALGVLLFLSLPTLPTLPTSPTPSSNI